MSSLRILTVCSHNRTRSVMSAAMLQSMLTERLGEGAVQIRTSGVGPVDLPPIYEAVDAMRRRGVLGSTCATGFPRWPTRPGRCRRPSKQPWWQSSSSVERLRCTSLPARVDRCRPTPRCDPELAPGHRRFGLDDPSDCRSDGHHAQRTGRVNVIGGTDRIRTCGPCGRPLSRRLHSSTLPPFR